MIPTTHRAVTCARGVCVALASRSIPSQLRLAHTETPTPPFAEIDRLSREYVLPFYSKPNMVIVRGRQCHLFDSEDKRYLDLTAGISVNALGYGDRAIRRIVTDQFGKVVHLSNLFHNEYAAPLAERLVKTLPEAAGSTGIASDNGTKVFFSNSGTEANEGALKFARKYAQSLGNPEKTEIVSFFNSFHGRTFGSLSATPTEKYQKYYTPLLPGFSYAKFNELRDINRLITEKTCAVIVEPVQGEGGIRPAEIKFLRRLRELCDQHNVLLIFDEVQCGLARSSKLHCFTHVGAYTDADGKEQLVRPDILTLAKPIANGYPMGAIVVAPKVASVLKQGDHGTTFGGSPMACRIALNVVERLSDPKFLAHVDRVSRHMRRGLRSLIRASDKTIFTELRGVGLILGVQVAEGQDAARVVELLRTEANVLAATAGNNTVRVVPPLIMTRKDVDEAVAAFKKVHDILKGGN